MKIEKTSGNHAILDSGSIITFDKEANLEFQIEMNASFQFSLLFKFESNASEQHELKSDVTDNSITLTCVNFDNSLGTGTTRPIQLATFEGKKVYINFWVYALSEKSLRKIVYTIYIEKDR